MDHVAGHDELAQSFVKTDKDLIGGEDHIFEAWGGSDGLDLASSMFQSGMKSLPLLLRLGVIDRGVPRHVGIFLVDDVEIGRGAQEDLFWHVCWNGSEEAVWRQGTEDEIRHECR